MRIVRRDYPEYGYRYMNQKWRSSINKYVREKGIHALTDSFYIASSDKDNRSKPQILVRIALLDPQGKLSKENKYILMQSYYDAGNFSTIDLVRLPGNEHRDIFVNYMLRILGPNLALVHRDFMFEASVYMHILALMSILDQAKKVCDHLKQKHGIDIFKYIINSLEQRKQSLEISAYLREYAVEDLYKKLNKNFSNQSSFREDILNPLILRYRDLYTDLSSYLSFTINIRRFIIAGGHIEYGQTQSTTPSIRFYDTSGIFGNVIANTNVNNIASYLISLSRLSVSVEANESELAEGREFVSRVLEIMNNCRLSSNFISEIIKFHSSPNEFKSITYMDIFDSMLSKIIQAIQTQGLSYVEAVSRIVPETLVTALFEHQSFSLVNAFLRRFE